MYAKDIIIIVPTYNEAGNIERLITEIYSLKINLTLLVVDDNSPDGTSGIIEKLKYCYPNLYLIKRKSKLGLASAYIEGFKYVLINKYDVIIQMDGDLSHCPGYILGMLNLMDDADFVIGSRYVEKGGTFHWGLGRLFMSRLANIFAKVLIQVPVNDLTSGFKCMKRSVLESVDLNSIKSDGYSFQIEMVFYAFLKGFKIIEYPIIFKGRMNEKSKMSLGIVLEAFLKVISLFFYKNYMRILCSINYDFKVN